MSLGSERDNNYWQVGKTAVIILEYNNSEDTINCIESVLQYNSSPIRLIVVDNGSSNRAAVSALEDYFAERFAGDWLTLHDSDIPPARLPYLTFLESGTNDGYAGGNNKGLALADADPDIDAVLILNSDILFVEDVIPALRVALARPDAAIVSPVLFRKGLAEADGNCARRSLSANEVVWMLFPYPYDAFRIGRRRRLRFNHHSGLMPIELPSGSCMLLRKDMFRRLGWFDPSTFLYFEEDILFEKVKSLGLSNYLVTDVRCIHLGATTTKSSSSRFVVGCAYSSAAYYLEKYKSASYIQLSLLRLFSGIMSLKFLIQEKLKLKKTPVNS